MELEQPADWVRVVPDALVGMGIVVRRGAVVPADLWGPYLEDLIERGALAWEPKEANPN